MATEALERTDDDSDETVNLGGRPTVYRDAFNKQATKLCRLGATDDELAEFFSVSVSTIEAWKRDIPRFSRAIQRGKSYSDAHIADRLYKRAAGYSHPDTKLFVIDNKVEKVEVTKHYPPDTAAAKHWLNNRRPDRWRDNSSLDVTSNGQSIGSLAAAAWAYGEEIRAQQQVQTIEVQDAQKLLSVPAES